MNSADNGFPSRSGFLGRALTIPAWLLGLIALLAILAAVFRIAIPDFVWVLIVIILLVLGWISSPSNLPRGRTVELSDRDGDREYRMVFSGLPAGVNPRLLPIADRQKLRDARKDKEIKHVLSVAGDIAFFDDKGNLVSSFASPVRLTLYLTDQDKEALAQRTAMLNQKVELIPAYLYSPVFKSIKERDDIDEKNQGDESAETNDMVEQPDENLIWMPFQNFTRDDINQTLTIEFMFWGDQPVGPSTKP